MHDMPDTEDEDAAGERFWPEAYKNLIRTRLGRDFADLLQTDEAFKPMYERHYADRYDNYERFVERLAEMVVIGAENGVDAVLDEAAAAFRHHAQLPEKRLRARYYPPQPFADDLKKDLHQHVFNEFRNHHAYVHIYEDHHYQNHVSFDEFIHQIASLVVAGATNGADDALGNIYRAFLSASPLPPARRRPKRLR